MEIFPAQMKKIDINWVESRVKTDFDVLVEELFKYICHNYAYIEDLEKDIHHLNDLHIYSKPEEEKLICQLIVGKFYENRILRSQSLDVNLNCLSPNQEIVEL